MTEARDRSGWQFFIDVGGTFTDVVARRPDGAVVTHKLLSSGVLRGTIAAGSTSSRIQDTNRRGEPDGLWSGYRLTIRTPNDTPLSTSVGDSEGNAGSLIPAEARSTEVRAGTTYELSSHEEAPVVAIRQLMGLCLDEPIGPVDVRLGTTRATNALLERKGAKVALVTTAGFGDVLRIGYQDRPKLFDLNIRKRDELASVSIEIDERLAADGSVLTSPDPAQIRDRLTNAKQAGIEAVAICLLHAHVNPIHEDLVAEVAASVGFGHVAVSSRVAPLERIVPRGDTTVVDAYLGTVIRSYVDALRSAMPEARIKLMTSNGGLIDAAVAMGKDTILSGPAGGVVGCAHISRAAGFDRAIGFDMGGTSTDVSRIDAPPAGVEYQHETVKAGVRIMTPMLAVETVAAGGGSICDFDGQKLTVGPESGGADPGPACYGRGGPLTVTDMNVSLGRVVPEFFPFQLDRDAIFDKLSALADTIETATGKRLNSVELAKGFIKIANANMAAAIKRISVAKGYDVRDYALCSFGGAGGQHACAIAEALGMSRIIFSPYAGVLSALGAGVTDVKHIAQRSVCIPLDSHAFEALGPVLENLAGQTRRALVDGGDDPGSAAPVHTIDLCYVGQVTRITVGASSPGSARAEFEEAHRRLYGYCHEGRDIEVRVARTEVTAPAGRLALPACRPASKLLVPSRRTRMVVGGEPEDVPVYLRSELEAGHRFAGPAVVIEPTSTVVVEPGWQVEVNGMGDLLLERCASTGRVDAISTEADPIQLELFNNQFTAIAAQMGATLRRTALSTNVKERLDFSCAIFTPDGDLVVNAPHIPVHLGAMSECVKALIEDAAPFEPGDIYITNDPYRGGSHLNDVTVISPIYGDTGEHLQFFVASRAHHAEIGGTRPGSMPPDSTCLADEGVVIRAFRWIQDGRPRHEALRALLTAPPYPSRLPDDNLADIAAQIAANQNGIRDLTKMIERYGVTVVHAYMHHIQRAAEAKMRTALAALPDGIHRFEDRLDDGSAVCVAVTIEGDSAVIDFGGTGPVLPGNLNANRAIVTSAVLYCLRCLIDEDIPLNSGVLAPVRIVLPECLLNPRASADPAECPAMVGGNVETSQRVVDTIFGALRTVAASQGTMNNLLLGDDTFGYYETICGGAGAGPRFDGADAVHTNMTNTRLTDPEVLESRYPVRVVRFGIRGGSGGRGHHSGGSGIVREIEALRPLEVSILSQRRTTPPYGVAGGEPGGLGRNLVRRSGQPREEELPSIAMLTLNPGDRLTIETPGGGGYGRPT